MKRRMFMRSALCALYLPAALLLYIDSAAAQTTTGTPGVAVNHVRIKFNELPAFENLRPDVTTLHPVPEPRTIFGGAGRPVPSKGSVTQAQLNSAGPPAGNGDHDTDSPNPSGSFQGLFEQNGWIPPDTMGAVGPNNVGEVLNDGVQFFNRSGSPISGQPEVALTTFFASHASDEDAFDPRIVYDAFNNRWVASADAADLNNNDSDPAILIGISATSDPTGTWDFWRIPVDTTNKSFADYPQLGINKNWIVISANMFATSGSFLSSDLWALNKANFYAGGAGSYTKLVDSTGGFTMYPANTLDNTQATEYILEDWNGDYQSSGYLRLSTITGAVGSETLTSGVQYPSASSTWNDSGGNIAPQEGTANDIDASDARLMDLVYRNGYLWTAHTVFLPATGTITRTDAQWWQIDPTSGAAIQFGRIDDPTNTLWYAYPSIGVNSVNDALVGYTQFSKTTYASAGYAFRNGSDPLNTLQSPLLVQAGLAPYAEFDGSRNRWGDYSNTVVDPLDDVTLWTIQEYAGSPSSKYATIWANVGITLETLSLNPNPVQGGQVSVGTVTLSGMAQADTVVNLTSGNGDAVVPPSVTVKQGTQIQTFNITTSNVASNIGVGIQASLNGDTKLQTLTITPAPVSVASLSLSPTGTLGGGQSTGTVTLSATATSTITVNLSSANAAVANPTVSSITITSGSATGQFTVDTNPVAASTTVTITASGGGGTANANLRVWAPAPKSVVVKPSTIVGGAGATGTVTISAVAPTGGLPVALSSSNTGVAGVQTSVTVNAGATTATFPVTTTPQASSTNVTITATATSVSANTVITVGNAGPASVSLSPNPLLGGGITTGTVTLTASAAAPVTVNLSSANSGIASPTVASITIPTGSSTGQFSVQTYPVAANISVGITAAASGGSATGSLRVWAPTPKSVTVSPNPAGGGVTATGTVTISAAAPTGGLAVGLSSSNSSVAGVPTSVTVNMGATTAMFPVTTTPQASSTNVTITATATGASANTTLAVGAPSPVSINLNPTALVGGGNVQGTVTLSGTAVNDVTVNLSSSNSGIANPTTTSITITAGSSSGQFTVATFPVAGNTTATITASTSDGSANANLRVWVPAVSGLTLSPNPVTGGSGSTGTVTINGAAGPGGVTVTLSSGNSSAAGVPATVTVPQGQTSVQFPITTSAVTTSTPVTISATSSTTKTATLTVNP